MKQKKSYTKNYRRWASIQNSCNNQKNPSYKNYGGRGIKCEWQSFEEFYRDMGDPPTPEHSLDRIDNNGNYCKRNCRWATSMQQMNNTRKSRELSSLTDWGALIKKWRIRKNLPLREVARIIELKTRQGVSEIERNNNQISFKKMFLFKEKVCKNKAEREEFEDDMRKIMLK